MNTAAAPGITISEIHLERISFKHKDDYLKISPSTRPSATKIDVSFESALAADKRAGRIRVTASTTEDPNALYQLEVSFVAFVAVDDAAPNMSIEQYMAGSGWALVLPFVREAVANITMRGRFGPVWLNPVNVALAASKATPAAVDVSGKAD